MTLVTNLLKEIRTETVAKKIENLKTVIGKTIVDFTYDGEDLKLVLDDNTVIYANSAYSDYEPVVAVLVRQK